MDPPDDEDVVLQFDLPPGLTYESPSPDPDISGLQRTAEGSGQSSGCGSYDIVEGRSVGLRDVRGNSIVGRNRTMDSEQDRFGFSREISPA
ncbi:MAG TPA: hypothetical protein VF795_08785 [Desulfuromonadaceae bacterium]